MFLYAGWAQLIDPRLTDRSDGLQKRELEIQIGGRRSGRRLTLTHSEGRLVGTAWGKGSKMA